MSRSYSQPIKLTLLTLSCFALSFTLWTLFSRSGFASQMPKTLTNQTLKTPTGDLAGTLEVPEGLAPFPVVLLIAGSGPTDRDGNQMMMQNNSLKHLALDLKAKGIASLRYDKRGVAQSIADGSQEKDLRFEHYIADAAAWVQHLRKDTRFDQVFVLGHSEGSLIGMLAAHQAHTSGFISLAGVGSPAAEIIGKQLMAQSPALAKKSEVPLAQLSQGKTVKNYPKVLHGLFRPSVQPYLMSWFKYNPAESIQRLEQPVLILQGDHDIQVKPEDAELLFKALVSVQKGDTSQKKILKGMNHVLKAAPLERKANLKTYAQPDVALHPELIPAIVDFVKKTDG